MLQTRDSESGVAMTSTRGSAADSDKLTTTERVITVIAVAFLIALAVGLWYWPSMTGASKLQECTFKAPKQSAGSVPTSDKPAKLISSGGWTDHHPSL